MKIFLEIFAVSKIICIFAQNIRYKIKNMTDIEKKLLLLDLCARLPYDVKCKIFNDAKSYILSGIIHNKPYGQLYFDELDWKEFDGFVSINDCKPYLFPLSSMTEEQIHDFFCRFVVNEIDYIDFKHYYVEQNRWNKIFTIISDCFEVVAWFNENHFDINGLIPMDLAIDATDKNIY